MAFDIYGNRLRPGYCEVHPDVHESYPCYQCMDEYRYYQEEQDYYNEMCAAYYNQIQTFEHMFALYGGVPACAVHRSISKWYEGGFR